MLFVTFGASTEQRNEIEINKPKTASPSTVAQLLNFWGKNRHPLGEQWDSDGEVRDQSEQS